MRIRIQKLFLFSAATLLMGSALAQADSTMERARPQKFLQHEAADSFQSDEREPSSKQAYSQDESNFKPIDKQQIYHTRGRQ